MKEKTREIEVITTVEITHVMNEEDLKALENDIPQTPEDLADWKRGIAESFSAEIYSALLADHVNVTNVQVFMKEEDGTRPLFEEDPEGENA
jgi:hypothetical protein